ncbi:MAG: single-stranded DNA-binding protein [Candidatus Ancillula sp.]|nr:single-stranded DNA-binding protein [Candidatus Ancillula sp.]
MAETNEEMVTQAELGADYIEELLDIADIDGDIETGAKNDRPYISIVSENQDDLKKLTGEDGEVLLALQNLTRLTVGEEYNEKTGLLLDINGWREERLKNIISLADDAIAKAETEGAVELPGMNSFERKTVHDYVSEKGFFSKSEGIGKERHIVVLKEQPAEEDEAEESAEPTGE